MAWIGNASSLLAGGSLGAISAAIDTRSERVTEVRETPGPYLSWRRSATLIFAELERGAAAWVRARLRQPVA